MATSLCSSAAPLEVRLVNNAVHLIHFQEIHQPHQHRFDFGLIASDDETGQRINNHDLRFEGLDRFVHRRQVHFQARKRGAVRLELEQTFLHPRFQVDPDRTHIAHDLAGRFLEGKIEGTLAAPAGRLGESARRDWSCRCPPCRRPARCCRGNSPRRPAWRRGAECRWRSARWRQFAASRAR